MTRGSQAFRMPLKSRVSMAGFRSSRLRRFGNERPKVTVKITVEWASLIGRVAEHGDREAFGRLFAHFAPRVKGMMLKAGAGRDDAEEIAQETLLAVWRKAAQFDPATAGASAWIFTIARNLRIDAVRRAARSGTVDHGAELDYVVDPAEPADHVMARNDEADRIAVALSQLSEEQSMAIRLSFIDERPHSEIADFLGIPLGTVKSRIRLAMNRLRALLDEAK
jgi:RNA polymerase sigma factor (sigma-70 family)